MTRKEKNWLSMACQKEGEQTFHSWSADRVLEYMREKYPELRI